MSREWPGGLIRSTPITPTGPLATGTAPGVWTLDQMAYWLQQGLWPIAGNFPYVEDTFSTWLYTGNGGTQTITNGIDLTGRGGLTWIKDRANANNHALFNLPSGGFSSIGYQASNLPDGSIITSPTTSITTTNSGFSLNGSSTVINGSGRTYVSWTFREQPRFFDIVTYTGNGANRTIAHNLGSVPGCIMVKRLDASADWQVYHRSLANTQYQVLNSPSAAATGATRWNSTTPTDTVFSLGTDATVNANGGTYVAYLFAHNAGGFGATGTDNVISCGSYTGNGSTVGPVVTLGYEPQWLLIKKIGIGSAQWILIDNMRGFVVGGTDAVLNPNLTAAETASTRVTPTATGFQLNTNDDFYNENGSTYMYIAIRRGPMRTPTTGTSVFGPQLYTGNGSASRTLTNSVAFPPDWMIVKTRSNSGLGDDTVGQTRLTGLPGIFLNSTNAEIGPGFYPDYFWQIPDQQSFYLGVNQRVNASAASFVNWSFRRAPGFFDVVCYTGTGVARTVAHNLSVVPELMIVKSRSGTTAWQVYSSALLNTEYLVLNTTAAKATGATRWNSTAPTNSAFSLGTASEVNTNNATYAAYLFASAPGVSKVGTYTGTGATQVVNCGFAAGARFVLIKRTDSTGDWYVWDSARGIVAGNDPYLLLNSTAAEVTTTDWVDTAASGFELSNAGGNLANTNGASYIFLAIS